MAVNKQAIPGNKSIEHYYDGEAVTYDTATTAPFRGLWVGAAGDVAVTTVGGNNVTFKAVPAGTELRVRGRVVLSAGTTVVAGNIVALY